MRFYDGTTGLKTGSTNAAGYCISATAERDGMELIAVILKGKTSPERFADAQTLLNYGFASYALKTVIPDEPLPPVPVTLGTQATVQPVLGEENQLLLEKAKTGELSQSVRLWRRSPCWPARRFPGSPSAKCCHGCCGSPVWLSERISHRPFSLAVPGEKCYTGQTEGKCALWLKFDT